MMRRIPGLAAIALIAMTAACFAVQYPLAVTNISVEGNSEIKLRDILAVVHFDVGDEIADADLKAASQAIYDLGWFSEVTLDRSAIETGHVVFRVVENPVIRAIEITGNDNRRDYRLFEMKLFDARIMSTAKIKQILWQNDIRRRTVLNTPKLTTALEAILEEYQRRGYVLISVGDVGLSETLRLEFIEQTYSGSLIEGLTTVPQDVAQSLIKIPVDQPLRLEDLQGSGTKLNESVFFSDVSVTTQPGFGANTVWLRWTLTERRFLDAPTLIRAISIEGNTVYDDESLAALLGEAPAEPVDNYGLLKLVQGVHDRYIRAGYSMVELSVAGVENDVLRLHVSEGEISEIAIAGNTRTHTYVIERNSELEVGTVFNRKDLIVTYQQLMGLGYFASVDPVPTRVGETVQVTLTVTEKKDLGGFGGSMAIDPSTGALYGELNLNEKNIFGTGQDIELSYSRGLIGNDDDHPSTWNLGYSSVAYVPGFDRVGVDLYQKTKEMEIEEDTVIQRTLGAGVSFSYPVAAYSSLGIAFRHEEERVSNQTGWTPTDVISLALAYDDTNDPLFPTEGGRRRIGVEKAGGFSSGNEYTKFDLTWTNFAETSFSLIPQDMRQGFAIRIMAGWADESIPLSSQIELGGSTSIRGVTGAPARQYAFANIEHRIELVEGLYATAFCDAGVNLAAVRFDDVLASCGFELGLSAAGVLIRLDFVWILSEEFTLIPVFDFAFGQMF